MWWPTIIINYILKKELATLYYPNNLGKFRKAMALSTNFQRKRYWMERNYIYVNWNQTKTYPSDSQIQAPPQQTFVLEPTLTLLLSRLFFQGWSRFSSLLSKLFQGWSRLFLLQTKYFFYWAQLLFEFSMLQVAYGQSFLQVFGESTLQVFGQSTLQVYGQSTTCMLLMKRVGIQNCSQTDQIMGVNGLDTGGHQAPKG